MVVDSGFQAQMVNRGAIVHVTVLPNTKMVFWYSGMFYLWMFDPLLPTIL